VSSSTTFKLKTKRPKINAAKEFVLGVTKVAGGTFLSLTLLTTSVVAGGLAGLAISFRNLPDVRVLRGHVPAQTSYVYDVKGVLLASFHSEEHRQTVELNEISPELKRAVLAIEDSNFYYHEGINPTSVARAILVNYRSGVVVVGASTLTMQLAKNMFLSHQRSYSRKLAEAILALRIEQVLVKMKFLICTLIISIGVIIIMGYKPPPKVILINLLPS